MIFVFQQPPGKGLTYFRHSLFSWLNDEPFFDTTQQFFEFSLVMSVPVDFSPLKNPRKFDWVGVCDALLKTHSLFQTRIYRLL